ncbi:twin-arginine translocase subunit TatC [Fictibacillus aquaticus]|uniref:Sec-independent protein translocase protein TatC n=1 Tax=Fictibacillus aquaticus TaxID=2021314 RepID=A0A235FEQ1_9BACL|nr:twin-arginine translocase subunit TatC [Fictibacillus aquaticus]OYD59424.1 twin-arginine translocase subunit TatC [Fictibacillus aquaticus]
MKNQEMLFVEHLGELRKRILITLGAFLLFFCAGFYYVEEIYNWLVRDLDHKLAILGPSDILWIYFVISGVAALAFTIPVAAHQTWMFVKPALGKREQRITLSYIPALFLLFLSGLSFGYFIVYPMVLQFLMKLSEGHFEVFFTSEKYFSFVLNLTLPFGFLFEIPLIVMFLTSIGIINPEMLKKSRKIAYFGLILVSITITPPDFVSDFLVTIPLLLLYEVSISISRIMYKKKHRNQHLKAVETEKAS